MKSATISLEIIKPDLENPGHVESLMQIAGWGVQEIDSLGLIGNNFIAMDRIAKTLAGFCFVEKPSLESPNEFIGGMTACPELGFVTQLEVGLELIKHIAQAAGKKIDDPQIIVSYVNDSPISAVVRHTNLPKTMENNQLINTRRLIV